MNVRLCSHIKTNGKPCRAVAITGRSLCFFHQRLLQHSPRRGPVRSAPVLRLGSLADRDSILVAMSRVVEAVASGSLNHQRAGTLLERIRLANDSLTDRERIADNRKTGAPEPTLRDPAVTGVCAGEA